MAAKDTKTQKDYLKATPATERLYPGNDDRNPIKKSKKVLDIPNPTDATFVVVPTSYYNMVLEALAKNEEKKGMSVSGIKKFMKENYPDREWSRCKNYVRKALERGLSSGVIIRPKHSEASVGLVGKFKLNKNLEPKPLSKVKPGDDANGTKVSTTGKRKSAGSLGFKVKKSISEKKKVAKGDKENKKTKVKGEKTQSKVKAASKGEGSSSKTTKTKDKKENVPPQVEEKKKSSKPSSK